MAPALALAPMPYASVDDGAGAEESMDEGLLYCVASKVGTFRRGRYAAGKKVGKGNVANVSRSRVCFSVLFHLHALQRVMLQLCVMQVH
jgi:hypothetical protein